MSEDDKRYIDPELEKFFKENKEMMKRLFEEERTIAERLLREEKERFKRTFEEEQAKAEKYAEEEKKKAKDTAQGIFNAFTDPEVQRHFMVMGMEFMMGMDALFRAMPFPDSIKDMAKKAEEARKGASDNFSKAKTNSSPCRELEKIEIESTSKKDPSDRSNTYSDKESD